MGYKYLTVSDSSLHPKQKSLPIEMSRPYLIK